MIIKRSSLSRNISARKKEVSPRSASEVVSYIGIGLTALSLLGGGLWVAFQFFYIKVIEPRLSSAVIQIFSEPILVRKMQCCYLYEITTKMENKGRRDLVIQASHQLVGSKSLEVLEAISPDDIKNANLNLLRRRLEDIDARYARASTVDYPNVDDRVPYLIASAGNIISPNSRLTPGEIYVNKSIAVVPKNHAITSIRGLLMISHFENKDIEWRWNIKDSGLRLAPLPWPKDGVDKLAKLMQCATQSIDMAERESCVKTIVETSNAVFENYVKGDVFSYMQSYEQDFFVKDSD